MAQAKVVNGATGTGSTTDITSSGFGTPDGAIILINTCTSADADTNDVALSLSVWDGSTVVCIASSSNDGTADTTCYGGMHSDVRVYKDGSSTVDAIGTISAITDGLRISWSDAPGSSWRYTVVLFGGGVSLKAGTIQQSGSEGGTAVYSSASFQPQAGIFFSRSATSFPYSDQGHIVSLGMMTYKSSTITQRSFCYSYPAGASFQSEYAQARNDRCWNDGSSSYGGEITAVSSSGFTITTRSRFSKYVGFLLIGGSGVTDVWLGDTNIPSATGAKSWEGPSFQPGFVLMAQTGLTTINTATTNKDECWSIGVAGASGSGGLCGWSDYSASTIDNGQRANTTNFLQSYQTSYPDQYGASFTDFDSLGWNVNYGEVGGAAASDVGFSLAIQFSTSVTAALSGSYGTAYKGALAPERSLAASGSYGSASSGALTAARSCAAAGSAGSAYGGVIGSVRDMAVSGAIGSSVAGALVATYGRDLGGSAGSAYGGSLVATHDSAPGGSIGSAFPGSLTLARDHALAGSVGASVPGAVVATHGRDLGGTIGSAYPGSLTFARDHALAGSVGASVPGAVVATHGRDLGGSIVAAYPGALAVAVGASMAGQVAAATGGTLLAALASQLVGHVAAATSGVIAPESDAPAALTGAMATAYAGAMLAEAGVAVDGSCATVLSWPIQVGVDVAMLGLATSALSGDVATGEPITGGVFSGAGRPGKVYDRKPKRRPLRIKLPELAKQARLPDRQAPEQVPVEAHIVLRWPLSASVAALPPDPVSAIALRLIGGMWREGTMIVVNGMWRELERRTSWQYQLNGKWINYD